MGYPKLVRDKIPEIIEQQGGIPKCHVAPSDAFMGFLLQKLDEETKEFKESHSEEEFVDILEVLEAIKKEEGFQDQVLQKIREDKAKKKGVFQDRIILLGINQKQ